MDPIEVEVVQIDGMKPRPGSGRNELRPEPDPASETGPRSGGGAPWRHATFTLPHIHPLLRPLVMAGVLLVLATLAVLALVIAVPVILLLLLFRILRTLFS